MKWVKVAIVTVIAILSISIIATNVNDMTQGSFVVDIVTFEIITESDVTEGTYNSLLDIVDDVVTVEINGNTVGINSITHNVDNGSIDIMIADGNQFYVYDDDTFFNINDNSYIGDTWVLSYETLQPPQLTGISATLILLAPLIFTGGVLVYLLNKQNY